MDRSNDLRGLERRKGCDFCASTGRKCDTRKPACSWCECNGMPCWWTSSVQKRRSTSRQPSPAIGNERRFGDIEERLDAIEAELRSGALENRSIAEQDDREQLETFERGSSDDRSEYSLDNLRPIVRERVLKFYLPPRDETHEHIQNYLAGFNQALPIFSSDGVLKMFHDWYEDLESRWEGPWACINVIMALSIRHIPRWKYLSEGPALQTWTDNARSVVDELIYRDTDLDGLRVLLGLAVLHVIGPDTKPASTLIATAVSLVYRQKLQRMLYIPMLGKQDSSEGARLFWITYILDRQTSLRTREPYLLQDVNIGITLDDMESDCKAGYIPLGDDQAPFNILKYRIQLGIIQGKLYDLVYSVRASKMSPEEQEASKAQIDRMLDEWYSSLPDSAKTGNFAALDSTTRRHCRLLHMIYYETIFSVQNAAMGNYAWIGSLNGFGSDWRKNKIRARQKTAGTKLLLPNWPRLLQTARAHVDILSSLEPKEDRGLRWGGVHATEGALAVLAANNIARYERSGSDSLTEDDGKLWVAFTDIKDLHNEYANTSDQFSSLFVSCESLVREARLCYDKFFNRRDRDPYWAGEQLAEFYTGNYSEDSML